MFFTVNMMSGVIAPAINLTAGYPLVYVRTRLASDNKNISLVTERWDCFGQPRLESGEPDQHHEYLDKCLCLAPVPQGRVVGHKRKRTW